MQLFTWGDGVHGRLGHGDMEACLEPRQVAAFSRHRVLRVTCGHYHTAAICADALPFPADSSPTHGEDSASLASALTFDNEFDAGAFEGPASGLRGGHGTPGKRGVLYTWGGVFETHAEVTVNGASSPRSPASAAATGAGAGESVNPAYAVSQPTSINVTSSHQVRPLGPLSACNAPAEDCYVILCAALFF